MFNYHQSLIALWLAGLKVGENNKENAIRFAYSTDRPVADDKNNHVGYISTRNDGFFNEYVKITVNRKEYAGKINNVLEKLWLDRNPRIHVIHS